MDDQLKPLFSTVSLVCVLFLSVGLLGVGMLKLMSYPDVVTLFESWGFPAWSRYFIGVCELMLAILLLYRPFWIPVSIAIIVLMTGAIAIHAIHGQTSFIYGPITVFILSSTLFFSAWVQKK